MNLVHVAPVVESRTWTFSAWALEEVRARAKQLWDEGKSARQVCIALNDEFRLPKPLSRNAVIGYAHRQKWATRVRTSPVRPHKVRPRPGGLTTLPRLPKIKVSKLVEEPALVDAEIPLEQRKQFHELGPNHCRWMVGHPNTDHFYCGGEGFPYCKHHTERAYDRSRD